MKNVFLSIVAPVLLVTLGFGQTPAPNSNPEQVSIKGCLGGSDGNYTVAEDGTAQTFRITSSTVDLKPHLGHDVEAVGQTTNLAPSSGPADNTMIVTGVNMISDHCATATASTPAAADPTPTATDTTPTATTIAPVVADPAPATVASVSAAVADPTPTATVNTPATTDATPIASANTQAMDPAPTPAASAPMMASAAAPESTQRLPDTASSMPLFALAGLGLFSMGLLIGRFRTD
jgi:LPXTG-motif cell wall-anchored protein